MVGLDSDGSVPDPKPLTFLCSVRHLCGLLLPEHPLQWGHQGPQQDEKGQVGGMLEGLSQFLSPRCASFEWDFRCSVVGADFVGDGPHVLGRTSLIPWELVP